MFGQKKNSAPIEPETPENGPLSGKGRPTPSRKEAEAARKANVRAPRGTKAGKKASREADRLARARQREGMLAGDPRYLPARDQGPVRAYVRDFVDGRYTVAEYFIFMALVVLVLGFVPNVAVQQFVSLAFFAVAALIVIDTVILIVQLRMRMKKQFPDKMDRKGTTLYALMRVLQYRRLRMPKPRVARGVRAKKKDK
jgi:Flp pilus assembly protein TadB